MSEKDLWSLTLAQFNALAERFASDQEALNYRTARICWVIAEGKRDPKKRSKPFTLDDFMPKKAKVELTGEQMREQIEIMHVALGGEVK